MKSLFIIGNGFDLGHDLKTSYWDFRSFLELEHPEFLYEFEENYRIYPNMTEEIKKDLLWNRFEANLADIYEDVIVEDAVRIELGLESGDVGIEDTLYYYHLEHYEYINKLQEYLKEWVESIDLTSCRVRTSKINSKKDDLYLTFNYTSVLESVYGVSRKNVLHIHGALSEYEDDPIIGHGDKECLRRVQKNIDEAERTFNEKESSIYKVLEEYYRTTFKDVNFYMHRLDRFKEKNIDRIFVIGHSLEGVDMPYFKTIDDLTGNCIEWVIYCFNENEMEEKRESLISIGIEDERIKVVSTKEFYDL